MNPDSTLIETLYKSPQRGDTATAAACYAPDAHFRDIRCDPQGRD